MIFFVDSCVPGCIEYTRCTTSDQGLFVEVRYFQLHDLHIPGSLSSRYTQALVLQEAEENEQFIQDAALVRKETEKLVSTRSTVTRLRFTHNNT